MTGGILTFSKGDKKTGTTRIKKQGKECYQRNCLKTQKLIIVVNTFQSMKNKNTTQLNFNPVLLVQNEGGAIIFKVSYCNIYVFPYYVIYVDNMSNVILIRAIATSITHKGRKRKITI